MRIYSSSISFGSDAISRYQFLDSLMTVRFMNRDDRSQFFEVKVSNRDSYESV